MAQVDCNEFIFEYQYISGLILLRIALVVIVLLKSIDSLMIAHQMYIFCLTKSRIVAIEKKKTIKTQLNWHTDSNGMVTAEGFSCMLLQFEILPCWLWNEAMENLQYKTTETLLRPSCAYCFLGFCVRLVTKTFDFIKLVFVVQTSDLCVLFVVCAQRLEMLSIENFSPKKTMAHWAERALKWRMTSNGIWWKGHTFHIHMHYANALHLMNSSRH